MHATLEKTECVIFICEKDKNYKKKKTLRKLFFFLNNQIKFRIDQTEIMRETVLHRPVTVMYSLRLKSRNDFNYPPEFFTILIMPREPPDRILAFFSQCKNAR